MGGHEERFEREDGPLRPVVPRTVTAYLDCGRMLGGYPRLLYQEHFVRRDALPGMVASIQTFGSALNFHPHMHALVTDDLLQHGAPSCR